MTRNYTKLSLLCIAASLPFAYLVLTRKMPGPPVPVVRVATFNAALNRERPGQLLEELEAGSEAARAIAEVVQRNEVDVLLVCELDRDEAARTAEVLCAKYLAVPQNGQTPIDFAFRLVLPCNTGEPSGLDLDGDGATSGPGDAFGFGRFPGQYAMALLSRHPLDAAKARTFQKLPWSAMPDALRPDGLADATWQAMRLSSKSHWDVPVRVMGQDVHLLCSHPTPPAFDGPEDRNGKRNHDEIRFWVDYLTPGKNEWIVDDAGQKGGLAEGGLADGAHFVVLGDLNCDPHDGDSRREALHALLAHPRVQDPEPKSEGAAQASIDQWAVNAQHKGRKELDTADFPEEGEQAPGNLRVDYVLPSRTVRVVDAGVFWPARGTALQGLAGASDHRLVWVDLTFAAPQ